MDAAQTATHIIRLSRSLAQLTGRLLLPNLLPGVPSDQLAAAARVAPFVLLSHDTQDEPRLTYANAAAVALFALRDSDIGSMPTRLTAAPQDQATRAAFMANVARDGWTHSYSGPRVSRDGLKFLMQDATVWNVFALEDGGSGVVVGQAALFSMWTIQENDDSTKPPVVMHVHVRSLPQHAALVLALTLDNARNSRREPGCLRFEVLQAEDPCSLILVQQFQDVAAAAAHKETSHYLRWREAVASLIAGPHSAIAYRDAMMA